MISEMQDMAIDFQEEARAKKFLALKVAKEAQRVLQRKLQAREQQQLKLKEQEEQKKRTEAVMQLDDILPENNNLQKMNSIAAIFEDNQNQEPMNGQFFGDDENYFNQDQNQMGAPEFDIDFNNYQNPIRVDEEEPLIPDQLEEI